jgi:hypothetical protein
MKVSESNTKKERSAQVKIAIGVIFIFNFMSQNEMVWQIKIIIHSVNCFNDINLSLTEIILTVWGFHVAITKHFRKFTVNVL